jgi:lipopolysaccharide/colanic/teichoic acid biosynthesis glycosyltransferase
VRLSKTYDYEKETQVGSVAQQPFASPEFTGWRPGAIVAVDGGPARSGYFCCKRVVDAVVSLALLLLLSPLLLLIALLIKLDSRGPVLFVCERVGCRRECRGGRSYYVLRTFRFYKFRSMKADVDHTLHQRCVHQFVNGHADASSQGKFKLSNDPRVTRLGRALRRTSLDELPQLFNVVKGDMSLVGPRPVPPYEVALYQQPHFGRLAALPGITGIWQVKGRCQVAFEEMVRMDQYYARNASLWLDLKIMLLTIPAVLSGRGAE